MAGTVYADTQQLCDYALLKHVEVGKDAGTSDKLYKKWTKLWVVVHCEISPLDCFLGYCKKESKWLLDNQSITKYPLHTMTFSRITTKKHENVLQLEFPSQTLQLSFDSQTKMDHYYQLINGVSVRHHVDLVRAPEHPEREGDYIIEECSESYKAWKTTGNGRGQLCWEWHLKCIRRIQFHKNVEKLEVEVGRQAETGEGHFFFTGRHSQRLFMAMKDELLSRALQKQQVEHKSLPPSHGPTQVNLSRSRSLINSSHSSSYQHPVSNRVASRPVAAPEDSETSSEEYSPSDNSSYTGGSARDWPIPPYTPSPTPGSLDRAPPLPPRDGRLQDRDMYSPTSSSSSSASGYQFPRQVIHPTSETKPHYMKVDRGLMDTDSDYMTMNNVGFQKLNIADDDDSGYTDMQSAGKVGPLYDSTPEDIPPEFVEQFSRVFPNTDTQTATLTRNHSEPLLDHSSSPPPPPLPPHASLRLREPDPNLVNGSPSSNTFPGTRRT